MTSLTNIPEMDLEIFSHLEGYDVYELCHINNYNYQLCMNTPHLKEKYNLYRNAMDNTKIIINQLERKFVKLPILKPLKWSYFSNDKQLDANVDKILINKLNHENYRIAVQIKKCRYFVGAYHFNRNELIDILMDLFYKDYIKL